MVNVLFICLGNICRSPLAEGVFRHHVEAAGLGHRQKTGAPESADKSNGIFVDSAGTLSTHVGSAPDPRSILVAAKNGIDISEQVCRQISDADFENFDYILAMDKDNLKRLNDLCPPKWQSKVQLFLPFAKDLKGLCEIPDPYLFRDLKAFERVYDFVNRASSGLLAEIISRHFNHHQPLDEAIGLK